MCVTGVSGSGKSSLINQTLYPILSQRFYRSKAQPLAYKSIEGVEHIDKVINVDQSPIGRMPRSNPATYTTVFNDIRELFAQLPEAKIRGWKAGRFSFNMHGGRCDECMGNGYKTIQMHFMPDTWFSSWLWPISLFDGIEHPDNKEINYYYPTADLVTGPDIIFFWVARMIMAGYEYQGKMPFKHVYFTGIVRDKLGRKMSKSLGNSPDPLDLIERYGADGVRIASLRRPNALTVSMYFYYLRMLISMFFGC